MTEITVTKLDAARRQLRTAVELWFADADPVSVHTLAHASHDIIHFHFRLRGHKDLMFDSTLIKDEHRKDYAEALKASANFFKHTRRDADKTHAFNDEANHLFLTMSVVGLLRMGEALSDVEMAFNVWNIIHHPTWYAEHISQGNVHLERLGKYKGVDKRKFLKAFLEVLRTQKR